MRVLIAAGGTAGHVVPALAVAERLTAAGADVVFVGGERAEAQGIPAAGYELRAIRVAGLSRTNPLLAARGGRAGSGGAVVQARRMLAELAPSAVLGGGDYVAGPVGLAALGAPRAARADRSRQPPRHHEPAAGAARAACLSRLPDPRPRGACATSSPAGRCAPPATDRAAARRALRPARAASTCVLVFGGSLGARRINEAAVETFGAAPFRVLHASGTRDYASLARGASRALGTTCGPYIDDFAEALAACDLCVARAGGSIFEIAAAGKPALLVPYPHASADHQTANARWMADAGAAVVVPDDQLTPARLGQEVGALLADPARLAAMAAASAALARPDAAQAVADEVLAAAARGRVVRR